MKLFIGNTGNNITADDLLSLFSHYGTVLAISIPKSKEGNSRGFGYVIMAISFEGQNAINALNKKSFKGQYLSVSEAIYSERYNNRVAMPMTN